MKKIYLAGGQKLAVEVLRREAGGGSRKIILFAKIPGSRLYLAETGCS